MMELSSDFNQYFATGLLEKTFFDKDRVFKKIHLFFIPDFSN